MITNFKLFENTNREPEVGDYIVIDYKNEHMEHVEHENLFNTHVGKILEYKKRREYFNPIFITIKYDHENEDIFYLRLDEDEIKFISKSKEECEQYLAEKKIQFIMKYIKTFENIIYDNEPEVGDYIIIGFDDMVDRDNKGIFYFFSTHVGKILEYKYDRDRNKYVFPIDMRVDYDECYGNTNRNIFTTSINHEMIEFFSKNKKDVENYLIAKKYNL